MNQFISNGMYTFITENNVFFDGILGEIQKEATIASCPIIPPVTARFFSFLLAVHKPKKILEIGCAVGFSSGMMATFTDSDTKIITIERFNVMAEKAKINLGKLDVGNKVTLLEGDALDILPTLNDKYDMIFIDAAKSQYINFLPHCLKLLRKDGIMLADNVFQKGNIGKTIDEIPKRDRTIYRRMKDFIWQINNIEGLKTSIVPIGDGLSLSVKLAEEVFMKEKNENG